MSRVEIDIPIKIKIKHNIDELRREVQRIKRESDFGPVVYEGTKAIAVAIRREAPIGREGSIPRSIKTSSTTRTKNGWTGVAYTNQARAIFTNEGTGTHIPGGDFYEIRGVSKKTGREFTVRHPGIQGTHWFERGANKGSPAAFKAFREKVNRILGAGR